MWLAFAYINEYQKKKIEYKDMICERKNKVLSEVSLYSFSSFFFSSFDLSKCKTQDRLSVITRLE